MRKKYLLLLPLLFLATVFAQAQNGKISGKVLNDKNEPLASVSVKITGAAGGATTDLEGRYTLSLPANKKYQLEFSAVGYDKNTISDVLVEADKVTYADVVMAVTSKNLETVTVTAGRNSVRRETAAAVIAFQKNTNTVASVISAEAIRRSPDRTTGEVLKRTPGASIQEGKFLVIRGLADRYNQAMLNGILLTSTEPDRKTFSFDLIPSAMIDNVVINKAFVPEYPGEWAGGLIQVNTKDIPSQNFFNIQVGTGFNTQTIGKNFYKQDGGKLDWLGIDDGARGLPSSYKTKSQFDGLSIADRTTIGTQLRNAWVPVQTSAPLNASFQANGGFNSVLFGKKVGGMFGLVYNKNNRFIDMMNQQSALNDVSNEFVPNYKYDDDRYTQDVSVGAMASLTVQLNPLHKISLKSLANVNSSNFITQREGQDYNRENDVRGTEFTFRQNTFYTIQATGEHLLATPLKMKWYGSFNILDGYSPDQRRLQYTRTTGTQEAYRLLVGNSLSQESGSRIFQNLNDYIYTAGGDLSYSFDLFDLKQTVKGGYMLQIKDRLYDAKLFANYLPRDNDALRQLSADKIFSPENFGDGSSGSNQFAFDAIRGSNFRYLANTILNAGFLQFDNQFTPMFRVVWGARIEDYDQLVGSVKKSDPRHTHSRVTDILPGMNATLKLNNLSNLRLSGSQTVIRPELRELSFLNLYDFELNASVQGSPSLKRTKVTNADFRYELYPRSGEVFTAGVFFKRFQNPIEQVFYEGIGGASTFEFKNPEEATSYGAEVEFRKKLDFATALKNFTFQANAAYIYSRVKDAGLNIDRPMQGQSPYLFNLSLMYDLEKEGINATVLFNQVGERIYLVGDITAGAGSPDIYEAPRPLLDFQFGKKFLDKKAEIRLNVSDILNQRQYFYQNAKGNKESFQKNEDQYRFTRKLGTTFGITFNYSI